MGIPTPGFADVTPAGTPLPAGHYDVEVVKAVQKEAGEDAKNPGSIYIRLELQPIDSPEDRFFTNLSFVEKAKRFLMRDLIALGYSDEELRSGNFEIEPEDLEGRKAVAVVGITTYNDEEQNEVRRLMPTGNTSESGAKLPS